MPLSGRILETCYLFLELVELLAISHLSVGLLFEVVLCLLGTNIQVEIEMVPLFFGVSQNCAVTGSSFARRVEYLSRNKILFGVWILLLQIGQNSSTFLVIHSSEILPGFAQIALLRPHSFAIFYNFWRCLISGLRSFGLHSKSDSRPCLS